jgi:UDP-glucose 4-epimerase
MGDIKDSEQLCSALKGHDAVIHLASNPDIAKAMAQPSVDFDEGTYLTFRVVEAMRITGARRILYASGSGVYGDLGLVEAKEDHGPLVPVSTYGASKLAGEALICAYCHMYNMTGIAFRFANVVGKRQTHGVGFDFIGKLKASPSRLDILGDGRQSKSYVHVSDVVTAVLSAHNKVIKPFDLFNVATDSYITVTEIAEIVAEKVTGSTEGVTFSYGGGDRGWKGDVPVVRLNTDKIKSLGWQCTYNSREAITLSIEEMLGTK